MKELREVVSMLTTVLATRTGVDASKAEGYIELTCLEKIMALMICCVNWKLMNGYDRIVSALTGYEDVMINCLNDARIVI